MFDKMTAEEIEALAQDVEKVTDIDEGTRMMLYMALRTAALYKADAMAYREYLMSGKVTEAMLARRFVSTPKVTVEDRSDARAGHVVLIHHNGSARSGWRECIEGDGPFSREVAERIAGWIREYGAHAVEHARRAEQTEREPEPEPEPKPEPEVGK